jgi:hypothetical protein
MTAAAPPRARLERADWQTRRDTHRTRSETLLGADLQRRMRGESHPVWDFIFDYYAFRPGHCLRWSPGPGIVLEGARVEDFLPRGAWSEHPEGAWLDPVALPDQRREGWAWILALLERTAERPPVFACGGLHEWAMVYRGTARHASVPLRLAPDELAAFVESQPIACSHHDAFRFFTPAARPLNRLQPGPDNRLTHEQRGCLHANMDLYKWAAKLTPWIDGALLLDCLALARAAREIDMRASPYDLRAWGFEPIPMETAAGRAEFAREQASLAECAQPLRLRLIDAYREVLHG